MISKDGKGDNFSILWGGHSCYEGDIELMGPPSPPTRENLVKFLKQEMGHRCQESCQLNDRPVVRKSLCDSHIITRGTSTLQIPQNLLRNVFLMWETYS